MSFGEKLKKDVEFGWLAYGYTWTTGEPDIINIFMSKDKKLVAQALKGKGFMNKGNDTWMHEDLQITAHVEEVELV